MTVVRALYADDFIAAMQKSGLIPPLCSSVEIVAQIGHPVFLKYEVIADEGLLGVLDGVRVAEDEAEAGDAL